LVLVVELQFHTSRDRDALGGDVASWRRNIVNQILPDRD
jgi:hypothetical protein